MRHVIVLSVFSSAFLVLTTLPETTGDPVPRNRHGVHGDDTDFEGEYRLYPEDYYSNKIRRLVSEPWNKRGWKDLQSTGWGKRSWGDLQNGWGKRSSMELQDPYGLRSWDDLSMGKRDWSQLRGSWGKRAFDPEQQKKLDDIMFKEGENLEEGSGKRDKRIEKPKNE